MDKNILTYTLKIVIFKHILFERVISLKRILNSQLDGIIEDGIQNTEKVQETVNRTLQMMKNLTSTTNELSAGDLSSSLDILEKIVDVTNSTGSTIEKEVINILLCL